MPQLVTTGAGMMCTFGVAPSTLVVPPASGVSAGAPAATIMDCQPMTNIPPFGMCMSPSNPTVAAATAAALGVLTPMPCIPVTTPWTPGASKVTIGKKPALTATDRCTCAYGGSISITMAGQVKTSVT